MDVRAEIMQVWADELDQELTRFEGERQQGALIPPAETKTVWCSGFVNPSASSGDRLS